MAEESAILVFGMKLSEKQSKQLDDYFNANGEDDRVGAETFSCSVEDVPILFIEKSKKDAGYGGGLSFIGKEIVAKPEWEGILLAVLQKKGIAKPGKIGWWLAITPD